MIKIAKTVMFVTLAAEISLGVRLDEPDEQSAEHRARDAADAAYDRRGEALEAGKEPHEVEDLAEHQAEHHAGCSARTEPMKKVEAMTRSTSIPIIAAASRSNAVARIAFPSFVRATSRVRATISPTLVATTATWIIWTFTPTIVNSGSTSGPGSNAPGLPDPAGTTRSS